MLSKRAHKAQSFAIYQRYSGDTTIAPRSCMDLYKMLVQAATPEALAELMRDGERRTWRQAARMRCACELEFALERVKTLSIILCNSESLLLENLAFLLTRRHRI